MKFVCPDCGFESTGPGNCPGCETPLLRREDETEELAGGIPDEKEEIDDELNEDVEEKEEW